MKTKLIYIMLGLLQLIACKKDFDMQDPDVDDFVSIVRSGNYFDVLGYELPDFTMKHVSRLLLYCDDTSRIIEFPTSPYSSQFTTPKILNECLLWTIDGIRFENKYPSLEPCLHDTSKFSEFQGYARVSGKDLLEVSELYRDWYAEYVTQPSEVLKTKNLFEGTSYRW